MKKICGDALEHFELTEEHRLKGMCRICASSDGKLISIFGMVGEKKRAAELIHSYLPILVTPEDLLPISICAACLDVLSKVQLLVENSIAADKEMRKKLIELIPERCQLGVEWTEDALDEVSTKEQSHPSRFSALSLFSHAAHKEEPYDRQCVQSDQSINIKFKECPFSISEKAEDFVQQRADSQIYQCLYCSQTNSDLYILLHHQMKSHPGNLLKCCECEFVCSSDQVTKFHEHIQIHLPLSNNKSQRLGKSTCHVRDSAALFQAAVGTESVTQNHISEQINSGDGPKPKTLHSNFYVNDYGPSNQNGEFASFKVPKEVKKEVQWRHGFCGSKAKSKEKLTEHCSYRHRERIGNSLAINSSLTCVRCKKSFVDEVWLKDHLCHSILTIPQNITTMKPMSCLSCPDIFFDTAEFRKHLLSHTNSVQCCVCGAHFRSGSHLRTHMEKHEKNPSHKCPHCPRIFRLKSRLNIHLRTHTGEKPFMCVKCGKRFSTDCGFRLHMSAHEGKKPYVCALCGHTFNRPSNLKRHEVKCRHGKTLLCRVCQKSFLKREDLLCHRIMHTKEEREAAHTVGDGSSKVIKGEKFSCKVCSMRFDRVADLSQHQKESHTLSELEEAKSAGRFNGGAILCVECGKELYNKRSYERHMLTHAGERRFSCMICSNKYNSKFALDYHMYTHTGERPHKCDLCSEGFKTKLSLHVHQMRHTGEKPYKCKLCTMGFMTTQSLRLHLVSHSDLRRFSCEYCSATFKRKKTLVTHVRIHTGEKPFTCRYCGRQFTQKGTCSQHEKSHTYSRNPKSKLLTSVQAMKTGMHVTIIEDWKHKVSDSLCEQDDSLEVLVSQRDNVVENDGVQHMVLIEHDCVVDEQEIMAVNEEMVLEASQTAIVIEQDGILSEMPISGLKDKNSDPQMPVPDD